MPQRRKMTRSQALGLAALVPVLILIGVAVRVPPLWEVAIAMAILVSVAVLFTLFWRAKFNNMPYDLQTLLWVYLGFLPIFSILIATMGLAKAGVLQQLGLDFRSAALFGLFFVCPLIIFPPLVFLRRKVQREYQITDEEKEFKQTIRHMPTGWGMKPEEIINRGHFFFWAGVILGGGDSILAAVITIHTIPNGWEPLKNIILFAGVLLFCLAGIAIFFYGIFQALKYWKVGRRWREQAAGTVTIQGTLVDWWIEEGIGNKTLAKIQRKDGSSKMLLVEAEFDEALPEIGEDVEIDYLSGCEAVTNVRPLANSGSAEDQAAEI